MSLKFNDAIKIVVEELLETPKPKYQLYSQDAAEITAKMDQELININSIFKGTVRNWDETIQLYKSEVPKLRIPILSLKMPFKVDPQRVLVFSSGDMQPVNLKTSVSHPAVENGYLNGEKLTHLFICDLNRVINRISKITCSSGKIYKLFFGANESSQGGIIINIGAMENYSQDHLYILFKFFYQSRDSSAAADLKKSATVMRYVQILLQSLVNQSNILSFGVLNDLSSIKIESGIGSLLLEVIPRCIPDIQNPGPLISAYGKLLQLKQSDSVQLSEINEVFGLN